MSKLEEFDLVVATHYRIYSASQALRDYLRKNGARLLYVSHPLPLKDVKEKENSYFEVSRGENILIKNEYSREKGNILTESLRDIFLTLFWTFKAGKKYDLFIGVDNLNAIVGLFFKKIGRVKKVVYYTIDYFPKRFENSFLNWIYHMVDQLCVKFADETWNVSVVMADARERYRNLDRKIYNRQHTVPIGIWYNNAPRKTFSEIDKKKLIFVGHLLAHMGVDLVVKAIPEILKKIPDAKFEIIGGGEEEENLKKLAKKLGVEDSIKFWGWIRDRDKLEKIMSDGAVGLATFNTEILDDRVKNADPGKIKDYMLLGMPVITTDAISTASSLEKAKCGLVIEYKTLDLVRAVIKLLNSPGKLKIYRENALKYVAQFDYNKIFAKNLSRVLTNN